MIIACPACATRYEVPDRAIRAEGRTVRCAKCRHSWFQEAADPEAEEDQFDDETADGEEARSPHMAGHGDAAMEPDDGGGRSVEEDSAETCDADGDDGGPGEPDIAAPPPLSREPVSPLREDAGEEPDGTSPPPRRRRFRLWGWAALVFVGLAGATAAATTYWGVPDWMPISAPAFAATQPGLKLDFPADRQERRQLPNGTEFFGASGTITNVDRRAQTVPPILIVLRDQRDRIVYSWEVDPPKRRLAPGESVTVNEAITDVPRSARVAEIGWKPV